MDDRLVCSSCGRISYISIDVERNCWSMINGEPCSGRMVLPSKIERLIKERRKEARAKKSFWLYRVYNQGWPDGHEDSTREWGNWSMISAEDAVRLAKEDAERPATRYEFVPYIPTEPFV